MRNLTYLQRPRDYVNSTPIALQGATVAFNTYSRTQFVPKISSPAIEAIIVAAMAYHAKDPSLTSTEALPVQLEAGSVKDKIRRFSGNLSPENPPNNEVMTRPRLSKPQIPQGIGTPVTDDQTIVQYPNIPNSERGHLEQSDSVMTPTEGKRCRERTENTNVKQPHDFPAPIPRPVHGIISREFRTGNILDDVNYEWLKAEANASSEPNSAKNCSRATEFVNSTKAVESVSRNNTPSSEVVSGREKLLISHGSLNPLQAGSHSQMTESNLRPYALRQDSSAPSDSKPKFPPRSGVPSMTTWKNSSVVVENSMLGFEGIRPADSEPVLVGSSVQPRGNHSAATDTTGINEKTLADAIIASSLASSRSLALRQPPPPPPPPRRRRLSPSLLHIHPEGSDRHQSPSPPKGLKHTLRNRSVSDGEAETEKELNRRHIIGHHFHKHHEGDRKRRRMEVTEQERKRYEGVWAANKGLWITPEVLATIDGDSGSRVIEPSEMVLNLVVRDIWSRSPLPSYVLEQVWDLVNRSGVGMLSREEFTVGMWLIDQQLKGCKLPVKVPDSVWDSVRHIPMPSFKFQ